MKKSIILIIFFISSFGFSENKNINIKKQKKYKQEVELNEKNEVIQNNKEIQLRKKIIQVAKSKIGIPYVWGGENDNGFDCSGLVKFAYSKAAGIQTPRVANDMANSYERITKARELKEGDLIFFETKEKGRISHTGLYIGNGYFIHASSSYAKVVISRLDGFYAEHFRGGANIIKNYI